jgi:hypothetical protein
MKQIKQDIKQMTDEELNAYIRNLGGRVWETLPRKNRELDALQLESKHWGNLRQPKRVDMIQDV